MVDVARPAISSGRVTLAANTVATVRFDYDMPVTRILAPLGNSAGGVWWTDDDSTPVVDQSNWLPAGHVEEFEPTTRDGAWPVIVKLVSQTAGDIVVVQKSPNPSR